MAHFDSALLKPSGIMGGGGFVVFNDLEDEFVAAKPLSTKHAQLMDDGRPKPGGEFAVTGGGVSASEKENIDPNTGLHSLWRQHAAQAAASVPVRTPGTPGVSPFSQHNTTQRGSLDMFNDFKSPLVPSPAAATPTTATPRVDAATLSNALTPVPATTEARRPLGDLTKQFNLTTNYTVVETGDMLKKKRGNKYSNARGAAPAVLGSSLRSMR